MSNVIPFPTHLVLQSWRDPEDEDRLWTRPESDPSLLFLPPEYYSYQKRNGYVYRVQKSHSDFSWCLYVDTKETNWGWDQPSTYVRTLVLCRNGDQKEAIRRAKALFPQEKAFWVADGAILEKSAWDKAYDEWYSSL